MKEKSQDWAIIKVLDNDILRIIDSFYNYEDALSQYRAYINFDRSQKIMLIEISKRWDE